MVLGDDTYVYDPHHFLITSVDLPTVWQIIEASREKPCLGLVLKLDLREISQLMVDSYLPPPRAQQSSRGMATGEVTLPLLTAFQRLIDLLANPRISRSWRRSSSGKYLTVYWWAIKGRVCARWHRREVRVNR